MRKFVLVFVLMLFGAQAAYAVSDSLFQVALLQSLMQGEYDGLITVKELKQFGDTGIGTFQDVNGELIALNGKVYRAIYDGSIEIVPDEETVPFSNITFFDADITKSQVNAKTIDELKNIFNEVVKANGRNQFYMATLKGTYSKIHVRSELAQQKPYKPLAEALKTDQREFVYENLAGTVVALYCPDYMDGINTPGWHLHFISDDETKGGHVLDLSIENAEMAMDIISEFVMVIPNRASFNEKDLAADMKKEIKAVEVK